MSQSSFHHGIQLSRLTHIQDLEPLTLTKQLHSSVSQTTTCYHDPFQMEHDVQFCCHV
jgi:hypothetical protein